MGPMKFLSVTLDRGEIVTRIERRSPLNILEDDQVPEWLRGDHFIRVVTTSHGFGYAFHKPTKRWYLVDLTEKCVRNWEGGSPNFPIGAIRSFGITEDEWYGTPGAPNTRVFVKDPRFTEVPAK